MRFSDLLPGDTFEIFDGSIHYQRPRWIKGPGNTMAPADHPHQTSVPTQDPIVCNVGEFFADGTRLSMGGGINPILHDRDGICSGRGNSRGPITLDIFIASGILGVSRGRDSLVAVRPRYPQHTETRSEQEIFLLPNVRRANAQTLVHSDGRIVAIGAEENGRATFTDFATHLEVGAMHDAPYRTFLEHERTLYSFADPAALVESEWVKNRHALAQRLDQPARLHRANDMDPTAPREDRTGVTTATTAAGHTPPDDDEPNAPSIG